MLRITECPRLSVSCRWVSWPWKQQSWRRGRMRTLQQLQDPVRRPPRAREPIPGHLLTEMPVAQFDMDEHKFLQNLRSARKGVAPGPSGMICEHLRPLLENPRDSHRFFLMAEQLAQGVAPEAAIHAVRVGRLTALRKPDGGVRGIVAGDVVRRLIARTMAQQMTDAVKLATSPYQYALSTRAGCECISHVLQGLTELDYNATVLSIDGISAFDLISRGAMLQALRDVSPAALPFVRQFYGNPSRYLWEDDEGVVHEIDQGEGGEQGDPLMPLLFSLGQHAALRAVQRQLLPGELVFAYLDDIYVITTPDRVLAVYNLLQAELWRHARIRVHDGKTQVWNKFGMRPRGCDTIDRAARATNPEFTTVWRGSALPTDCQGIKVLGCPLGHDDFVHAHLERTHQAHRTLLQRIPRVPDVQSAWALLLHCASARANYSLRVVRPELVAQFAAAHDASLWSCLCDIAL